MKQSFVSTVKALMKRTSFNGFHLLHVAFLRFDGFFGHVKAPAIGVAPVGQDLSFAGSGFHSSTCGNANKKEA
jgi:hypothetical protein